MIKPIAHPYHQKSFMGSLLLTENNSEKYIMWIAPGKTEKAAYQNMIKVLKEQIKLCEAKIKECG